MLSPEKQHRSLQRSDLDVHKDNKRKVKKESGTTLSQKKKRSKKKSKDSRLNHPGMKIYRKLARLCVPHALRDDVIACYDELGEDRWERAVKEWIGRGHKPQNILGMIDVARHGFRDQRGGKRGEREDHKLRYQDALRTG